MRAEVHSKLGNIEDAIIDYQDILKKEKNNTKAKKELNWKPEYSLDDGMKQVFNWLRN